MLRFLLFATFEEFTSNSMPVIPHLRSIASVVRCWLMIPRRSAACHRDFHYLPSAPCSSAPRRPSSRRLSLIPPLPYLLMPCVLPIFDVLRSLLPFALPSPDLSRAGGSSDTARTITASTLSLCALAIERSLEKGEEEVGRCAVLRIILPFLASAPRVLVGLFQMLHQH